MLLEPETDAPWYSSVWMLRDSSGGLARGCGVATGGLQDPKESQILRLLGALEGPTVPSTGTRVGFRRLHPTQLSHLNRGGTCLPSVPMPEVQSIT